MLFRRNHNSSGTHEFQLVLPESYCDEIMALGHDHQLSGHCGARRILSHISDGFFFPKMWLRVKSYVRSCHVCQMTRALNKNERAPLQTTEVMQDAAFSHLQIDILGGDLPRSKSGYKYLLTIACVNSKWIEGVPLRNLRSKTISFFCTFGFPRLITSDNMSSFKRDLWTQVRAKLGIDARFSAPWHFMSHGLVERANRSIEDILKNTYIVSQKTGTNSYRSFCQRSETLRILLLIAK